MAMLDRLNTDLIQAMKSGQRERADLIRHLKSDIKYREIEKREALTEDDIIKVLASAAKRRRESIEQFARGGREDLVARERAQLELIEGYLPQALSEAELTAIVEKAIADSGAAGPADMGKVMKLLMPEVGGRADGKLVSRLVQARLAATPQ
ncbi:MAG: GatB/YqeY domain-containing protein [bacterium]